MAESIFGEKAILPEENTLRTALGDSAAHWDEIIRISSGTGEWKFYTKAAGWTYKVALGKRTLFYMLPKDGFFKLSFVFGERAVEAAKTIDLPPQVLEDLLPAKAYMEGRGVSVEIKGATDMEVAQKLLRLKLDY